MIPTDRMLRQRATLVSPGEALDDDGVPRSTPTLIGASVRCALDPLSLSARAQLRSASGATQADGMLYLGPEAPRLAVGDTASIAGFGIWTVSGLPAEQAGSDGQLGHRGYPAVQEA